ncbi:hypothetical protein LEMLEM_LOCUS15046, partial [Lemmus lemmus]
MKTDKTALPQTPSWETELPTCHASHLLVLILECWDQRHVHHSELLKKQDVLNQ